MAQGLEEKILRANMADLYEKANGSVALPRMYGLVMASTAGVAIMLVGLGMKVGKARTRAIEKAKKDGDEQAEQRFSYPNMYAEGMSEVAREFNCIQRGHQNALESVPQILAMAAFGGLRFPVTTSFATMMWIYARLNWADAYAKKGAGERYAHWSSKGIWVGLLFQLCTCTGTAAGLLLGM